MQTRWALVTLSLAVALAGCDQIQKMTGGQPPSNTSAGNTTTATGTGSPSLSAPAAPGGAPPKPVTNDPALEALVQQEVAVTRPSLPTRIDEITQVVGLHGEGTEFVYDVAISRPIPAGQVELLRQNFQAQGQARLCADPQAREFVRRGGSMSYRYSDTTGYRFETRIVSCS